MYPTADDRNCRALHEIIFVAKLKDMDEKEVENSLELVKDVFHGSKP